MTTLIITTPIYYPSSSPHIGHLFSTTLADYFHQYWSNCYILTGCDQHGSKIQQLASQHHITEKEYIEKYTNEFISTFKSFNIHPEIFIQTTSQSHIKLVQDIWTQLQQKGLIYKSQYKGLYDIQDECFISTSTQNTNHQLVEVQEENYFLKITSLKEKLLQFYHTHQDFIYPKRYIQETINFINSNQFKDISISRTKENVHWGIEVPNDPSQTIYVWFDALCSYILENKLYKIAYQILGKDIQRFHCIYYLCILLALDLPLPEHFIIHGWFLSNGQKVSKSLQNYSSLDKILEQTHIEPLRYYLLTQQDFFNDMTFSIDLVKQKWNHFVDIFGNLINRITSPKVNRLQNQGIFHTQFSNLPSIQKILSNPIYTNESNTLETCFDEIKFKQLYSHLENLLIQTNSLLEQTQIWTSTDQPLIDTVLFVCFQVVDICLQWYQPILIESYLPITEIIQFKKNTNMKNILKKFQ